MFKLYISCKCINIYRVLLILTLFRLLQEFKYSFGAAAEDCNRFVTCAICWIGCVKLRMYWKKDWISPTSITFFDYKHAT